MQPKTDSQLIIRTILPTDIDRLEPIVSESELSKTPMVMSSSGVFSWGYLSACMITAPGFCIDLATYDLETAINVGKSPAEPVLNLHFQLHNEAYCSFKGVENYLMKKGACTLFIQSTETANSYILPGMHSQVNIFYTKRFLKSIVDDLPTVKPLLHLLCENQPTPLNEKITTATPRMNRLIDDFGKYVNSDTKIETPFCRHTAIQMLKEFL